MQENHYQPELPAEGTAITTINNIHHQEVNEEVSSHNNIRDLIQDDQMFRMDCDPTFFDSMNVEDNINNNIGLQQIKDLEIICSDSWIPAASDIELFSELPDSLFEQEDMEKMEPTSPESPIPAPPSPVVEEPVEVKTENPEFDLIKYIIFGEVCTINGVVDNVNTYFPLSPQNADLLTPVEEKSEPIFHQQVQAKDMLIEIKSEPTPSTSTVTSPKRSAAEDVENNKPIRRRAQKRRYSSDSDFSIRTSASSFRVASQRSSKKKRGRPAKELITDLPTIDDFSHMPIEHASHLVLRIKNNEASRKSRMKSKSKQTAMEDECDRLKGKQQKLRTKKNILDGQIETLRRWLLGLN